MTFEVHDGEEHFAMQAFDEWETGRGSKSAVSGLHWILPKPRQPRVPVLRVLP